MTGFSGGPREQFCVYCGAHRRRGAVGGAIRCRRCGQTRYRGPAVGVAVVVVDAQSRILLGRRCRGQRAGQWCIPCGYVEWGEDVRAAARREVQEETGLVVDVGDVVAVHSNFHDRDRLSVGIWFRGRVRRGVPTAGDDLDAVAFFELGDLPPLAFPTDARVLASLRTSLTPAPRRRVRRPKKAVRPDSA